MNTKPFNRHSLTLAITTVTAALCASAVNAQEPGENLPAPEPDLPAIDELVVTARLKDSATQIIQERIEQPYAAEVLGVEQMVRVGDANVASALRRVTGLTLFQDKFIYVRGLGERYSNTTLNGADVPSPELTRNVIPLDLFPTSILDSVKVSKAFSPEQSASFGGGNIDIRTRGIPDGFLFNTAIGTGWNSNNSDDGYSRAGNGGELPSAIEAALPVYSGNLFSAPEAENRELITSLNRDIEITDDSLDPDLDAGLSIGNAWLIGDDWEFGALATYEYQKETRNRNRTDRNYLNPGSTYTDAVRTIEDESQTGAVNFGLKWRDTQQISTNSYWLYNEEDESRINRGYDFNFEQADGRQRVNYITQFEEREMRVNQVIGEHSFNDGDMGIVMPGPLDAIDIRWIYSLSKTTTDKPNNTNISAVNQVDPANGVVQSTALQSTTSVAQFNFLNLEDEVESYGMHFEAPFTTDNSYGSLSFGWLDSSNSREYYGYTANINATGVLIDVLSGTPSQVLTDAKLTDPANNFSLTMGADFGTESYVAAQVTESMYGGADITWLDTWRLTAGVRWEQYEFALLPLDLLDYSGVSIQNLIDELQEPDQVLAQYEDDYYPSIAGTYMNTGFLGAETFQVRLSYGNTVIRPDLRERSPVQYYDQELDKRVDGNPLLKNAELDHFDLRTEAFFSNGNSATVSLFYKDIANPIETIQELAGDRDKLTFVNSESGEIYGMEIEGLMELGGGFFTTGNITLSDSETRFDGVNSQTNQDRPLTGHSKYVLNAQVGYDSLNGQHSASLAYNVFSKRLFAGGISGNPDQYEQPFHSVDLAYSFYPTNAITVQLKLKNILNSEFEVEQGGITVIEEEKGTDMSLDFKYEF